MEDIAVDDSQQSSDIMYRKQLYACWLRAVMHIVCFAYTRLMNLSRPRTKYGVVKYAVFLSVVSYLVVLQFFPNVIIPEINKLRHNALEE